MATSRLRPLVARGREVLSGFSVPTGTATKTIALPRSDFLQGFLMIGLPTSVNVNKRRNTAGIFFTTADADAVAQATALGTNWSWYNYNYQLQTLRDYIHKGYTFDVDGFLTERFFGSGSLNSVRVTSCRINGSNIEIVFDNSSLLQTVTANIEWRVERPAVL